MNVVDYAERILFGSSLAEKLTPPEVGAEFWKTPTSNSNRGFFDDRPAREKAASARIAVESSGLSFLKQLESESARAALVHSFANHELQAIELMALALIRFQDAPLAFRKGVLATLVDEQRHFGFYLKRIRELGSDWGDFETSFYFWDTLLKMRSPLEYVTAMGLTFEQANLDFAGAYAKKFRALGDIETAAILETVLDDEKKHVKHGLHWFREWISPEDSENEFEAHRKYLIKPVTLVRAKGLEFSRRIREEVGLGQEYIDQLAASGGSKGRPPTVFTYNPRVEYEVSGEVASDAQKLDVERDLELMPLFFARESDIVIVEQRPSDALMSRYARLGLKLPDFRIGFEEVWEEKWAGVAPWGWSSQTAKKLEAFRLKQVKTSGASPWYAPEECERFEFWHSKDKQQEEFALWYKENRSQVESILKSNELGKRCEKISELELCIDEASKAGEAVLVKSPFGLSGMQMKSIRSSEGVQENVSKWIERTLKKHGAVYAEPLFHRVCDLAIQCEISTEGQVDVLGLRESIVDGSFAYRGTILDARLQSLSPELLRFVRSHQDLAFDWAKHMGRRLRESGYRGPFGIDQFIFKRPDGSFGWKLCSEVNLRYTMGRVALEIEKRIDRAKGGVFWLSRLARSNESWFDLASAVTRGDAVALSDETRAKVLIPHVLFAETPACDQLRTSLKEYRERQASN